MHSVSPLSLSGLRSSVYFFLIIKELAVSGCRLTCPSPSSALDRGGPLWKMNGGHHSSPSETLERAPRRTDRRDEAVQTRASFRTLSSVTTASFLSSPAPSYSSSCFLFFRLFHVGTGEINPSSLFVWSVIVCALVRLREGVGDWPEAGCFTDCHYGLIHIPHKLENCGRMVLSDSYSSDIF